MSKSGERVNGVIDGFNRLDAIDRIKQSCDIVLKLDEVKSGGEGLLNMEIGGKKLNKKAFIVMCSQFAIILRSGIPIARTVELIADKTTDKTLKKMLKQIASDVESGRSVSSSFKERGGDFLPTNFIETIRSGEESGNLDKAFDSMYHHYDKQVKMTGKVKSALAYPAFVLVIAIAVVIVLMVFVVPTFTAILDSYDAELPLPTQILISISNFFRDYILYIIAVVAVVTIAYKIYSKTEQGRMKVAELSLKVPILGNIGILNAASQFANSMTMMLAAGLPVTRSLLVTSKVMTNYYLSTETGKLVGMVEEGRSIGSSMREQNVMPAILIDMVAVGEETGELEDTLNTIAAYYDAELEMATDAAIKKLEPAILVGLAGVAGFIVISIYMAMFSMYDAM